MIPDEVLEELYCSLEYETHLLNEPHVLQCGHYACKKCINTKDELKCSKCRMISPKNRNFIKSEYAEYLLERYAYDLLLIAEERFKISFMSFKSKFKHF